VIRERIIQSIGVLGTTIATFAQEWVALSCGFLTLIILFPKAVSVIRGTPRTLKKSDDE